MADTNNEQASDKRTTMFTSQHPDAPSIIPDASKGPAHKQRAVVVMTVLVLIAVFAIAGYYILD